MSMFTVISTGYPELNRLEDRFISHSSATKEKIIELIETTRSIFNQVADFCDRHYSIDRMRFFRSERSLIALGYAIYKHNFEHESTLDRQLAHWLYIAALANQHNDMNRLKRDINTLRHTKAEAIYGKLIGSLNNGHLNWLLKYNGIKLKSKPKEELGDHDVKHSPNSHLFGCVYGLIRSKTALSFKDGTVIDGQAKLEVHHIYPRSTIREMSGEINRWHSDIANLTFITSKDNNEISNSHMAYLNGVSEDIKESHLIPRKQYGEATPSNYKVFLTERRSLIHTALTRMIENLEAKAALI